MLVVSLKELTVTKEVIQTLEQLLCDDTSQLEDKRRQVLEKICSNPQNRCCCRSSHLSMQVTRSRDTYQDLVRLMEQHRADRAVQLSILR